MGSNQAWWGIADTTMTTEWTRAGADVTPTTPGWRRIPQALGGHPNTSASKVKPCQSQAPHHPETLGFEWGHARSRMEGKTRSTRIGQRASRGCRLRPMAMEIAGAGQSSVAKTEAAQSFAPSQEGEMRVSEGEMRGVTQRSISRRVLPNLCLSKFHVGAKVRASSVASPKQRLAKAPDRPNGGCRLVLPFWSAFVLIAPLKCAPQTFFFAIQTIWTYNQFKHTNKYV
jgi:hypothetical protein